MNAEQVPTTHKPTTVGIIGYGRFGRVLADGLREDFTLRIHDPFADFSATNDQSVPLAEAAACDAVWCCVPIIHFEQVIAKTAPYLRSGALLLDVCSVKLYPEAVMKRLVASDVSVLPTHPMFGPDTAKHGWRDLPLVICPTSATSATSATNDEVSTGAAYRQSVQFWQHYLAERKGCRVVAMSSEEHDRTTAYTLCLTQLLGRVLGNIGIKASAIDAQSFTHLLRMKEISYNDSMELLIGLHRYNPFAAEMRRRLQEEFSAVEPFLQAHDSA
jgi:prephenate dehydrogenase